MRVLFVMTGADVGGAERLVAMLGRHWTPSDETRLLVLLGPGSLSPELESSFHQVDYLDIDPASRRIDAMVRGVEDAIAAFRPDVVLSHMFHADLVVELARTRVPKVSTIHTHGFGSGDLLLTKLIARAVGLLSFRLAAVIPTSDSPDMTDFLRRLRMKHVVAAIPNATEIPPAPAFDPQARRLVSIARNHPVKGQAGLIEAFASVAEQHPAWTLALYGPGVTPTDSPFSALLQDERLASLHRSGRLVLTGPTDDPHGVLAQAGGLVISSLYGETTPLVGLEAGAAGVPVITTRVGSCPTFVDDDRFVATPGDVADLARALDDYLRLTDQERSELSRSARARTAADHSPDQAARRYRDTLTAVIDRGGRSRH